MDYLSRRNTPLSLWRRTATLLPALFLICALSVTLENGGSQAQAPVPAESAGASVENATGSHSLIGMLLHIDDTLESLIKKYGLWVYGILFLVIFCETGLVVTPILPGDSLLFAAGALSLTTNLNPVYIFFLLTAAAILGDAVNYYIGYLCGPKLAEKGKLPFIKKEYLDRTHKFYEKYGKMTIIYARFVPIVRTFAPFLAGVGTMRYIEFATYNVVGGIAWVAICVFSGYFFGNIPWVRKHFEAVILVIIFVSVLPPVIEVLRHRNENKKARIAATETQQP